MKDIMVKHYKGDFARKMRKGSLTLMVFLASLGLISGEIRAQSSSSKGARQIVRMIESLRISGTAFTPEQMEKYGEMIIWNTVNEAETLEQEGNLQGAKRLLSSIINACKTDGLNVPKVVNACEEKLALINELIEKEAQQTKEEKNQLYQLLKGHPNEIFEIDGTSYAVGVQYSKEEGIAEGKAMGMCRYLAKKQGKVPIRVKFKVVERDKPRKGHTQVTVVMVVK